MFLYPRFQFVPAAAKGCSRKQRNLHPLLTLLSVFGADRFNDIISAKP
jgi:hypothetical protein